jgi:hypothetical protein
MLIHDALLDAVHEQPLPADTLTGPPLVAVAPTDWLDGVIEYVHGADVEAAA